MRDKKAEHGRTFNEIHHIKGIHKNLKISEKFHDLIN